MAKTTTRVRLTCGQKQELRAHHQEHPEKSLWVLCKWASTAFQLRYPPAHSTLIALFRSSGDGDARSTVTKTDHRVANPQLESELVRWIARCESAMVPIVTYATIREKAMKIRDDIAKWRQRNGWQRSSAAVLLKRMAAEVPASLWTQVAPFAWRSCAH